MDRGIAAFRLDTKMVRVKLDDKGHRSGAEDFITGWLAPAEKQKGAGWGVRGMYSGGDGSMYLSD